MGKQATHADLGESSSPTASDVSDGILGAMPCLTARAPLRFPQVPVNLPHVDLTITPGSEERSGRRPWMPKMDFPRFDGKDVRIWLDKCEAFFICITFLTISKLHQHLCISLTAQRTGIRLLNSRVHYTLGNNFV